MSHVQESHGECICQSCMQESRGAKSEESEIHSYTINPQRGDFLEFMLEAVRAVSVGSSGSSGTSDLGPGNLEEKFRARIRDAALRFRSTGGELDRKVLVLTGLEEG